MFDYVSLENWEKPANTKSVKTQKVIKYYIWKKYVLPNIVQISKCVKL